MASFTSMALCEARCRAQVRAKKWVEAHSERDKNGVIKARFIRFLNAAALAVHARGGWEETDQDNVD